MNQMGSLVVTFFASFFIYILFFGLFVLWVIDGKIKKEQVVHALFSCLLSWFLAFFIKEMFPTFRPFVVNGNGLMTVTVPIDGAFPSIHTALAFALSVTVFMHDRVIGWAFLFSALLIGAARVIANVHYPADILGGALLGTLVAVVTEKMHFMKFIKLIKSGT